ncbi:hypothetical protein [Streptosporangium sp. NPDC051022]|uniref:hypothetical protein n=1 Tax=Streptosporangium sp. NPDC051022 TaxID=3155752 RepID=UPI00343E72EE
MEDDTETVAPRKRATDPTTPARRRRLPFIGTMNSGVGDLAERHEEILTEGADRPI